MVVCYFSLASPLVLELSSSKSVNTWVFTNNKEEEVEVRSKWRKAASMDKVLLPVLSSPYKTFGREETQNAGQVGVVLFFLGVQAGSKISQHGRSKMWELEALVGLLELRALTYPDLQKEDDSKMVFCLLEE